MTPKRENILYIPIYSFTICAYTVFRSTLNRSFPKSQFKNVFFCTNTLDSYYVTLNTSPTKILSKSERTNDFGERRSERR